MTSPFGAVREPPTDFQFTGGSLNPPWLIIVLLPFVGMVLIQGLYISHWDYSDRLQSARHFIGDTTRWLFLSSGLTLFTSYFRGRDAGFLWTVCPVSASSSHFEMLTHQPLIPQQMKANSDLTSSQTSPRVPILSLTRIPTPQTIAHFILPLLIPLDPV